MNVFKQYFNTMNENFDHPDIKGLEISNKKMEKVRQKIRDISNACTVMYTCAGWIIELGYIDTYSTSIK